MSQLEKEQVIGVLSPGEVVQRFDELQSNHERYLHTLKWICDQALAIVEPESEIGHHIEAIQAVTATMRDKIQGGGEMTVGRPPIVDNCRGACG